MEKIKIFTTTYMPNGISIPSVSVKTFKNLEHIKSYLKEVAEEPDTIGVELLYKEDNSIRIIIKKIF